MTALISLYEFLVRSKEVAEKEGDDERVEQCRRVIKYIDKMGNKSVLKGGE